MGDEFEPRFGPPVEMTLFRLVQEALNNVAKHAHATEATIRAESADHSAGLTVADNGQGFDPGLLDRHAGQPHWGVLTMQQRAASVAGQLTVDSAPGRGTRVSVVIRRGGYAN